MKPIELMVSPNGSIRSVYDDSRLKLFEAMKGKLTVQRASNVEWEEGGWTVRAAHDPELAIRAVLEDGMYKRVVRREGDLLVFLTREGALESEQAHFWELLPPCSKIP